MHWINLLAFSVGHVLNDLCASMWFSYFLVFFNFVVKIETSKAGYLMLLGQVVDAISTPLLGLEVDRSKGICGYSKIKSWHLLGTFAVVISFPFVFMTVFGGDENTSDVTKFIYYSPFIVIFQFGWAATQISHLSLIPFLSSQESVRTRMNALRHGFTGASNITVYVAAWILLHKTSSIGNKDYLDARFFKITVTCLVIIGLFFTFFFHTGVKEEASFFDVNNYNRDDLDAIDEINTGNWFKTLSFYLVAVLYMGTRLVINLSQIYLPLYLSESLKLSKVYIAVFPLVVHISSFIISFLLQFISGKLLKFHLYSYGVICILGSTTWHFIIAKSELTIYHMYGSSILLGIGGAIILIQSFCITADLIGNKVSSGGFVYGCMSFVDKLANGLAVVMIQLSHPCPQDTECCDACASFYRNVLSLIPGTIVIGAFFVMTCIIYVTPNDNKNINNLIDEREKESLLEYGKERYEMLTS